jgi:hypothetical protein
MGHKSSKHKKLPNIPLDFSQVEPHSEDERQVFELIAPVLEKNSGILELLTSYSGCDKQIRAALGDPNEANEKVAWDAVIKNVDILYKFYKHAQDMEKVFPKLLLALCEGDPVQNIAQYQSLLRQFAELLSFAFRFDEAKMIRPAIQNDFSYYRRVLTRMRARRLTAQREEKKEDNDEGKKRKDSDNRKGQHPQMKLKVDEDLANKISLFLAYPTPIIKVLIDTTTSFDEGKHNESLVNGLALIANLCHQKVTGSEGLEQDIFMYYLCAMTGAIILTDHLHPQGAFHSKSPIRIKACITLLKDQPDHRTDFLLNSLRFTTIHLNEPQSLPAIQKMLA